jgi:CRP-like cAMP-binding protein
MVLPQTNGPRGNRLLAALPDDAYGRLRPHIEVARLPLAKTLVEVGEPIDRVYFPHDSIVAIVSVMENGAVAEMSTVGREGMTGIGNLWNGDIAVGRQIVQMEGTATSIALPALRNAVRESEPLRSLLSTYTEAFLAQVMQSQACNSLHSVQQRACRWLLLAHDRSGRNSFPLTQESLAQMLGVNRTSVTLVARTLQNAGLIRYRRGSITVTDRPGLEDVSCECYGIIRRHYERLLPQAFN